MIEFNYKLAHVFEIIILQLSKFNYKYISCFYSNPGLTWAVHCLWALLIYCFTTTLIIIKFTLQNSLGRKRKHPVTLHWNTRLFCINDNKSLNWFPPKLIQYMSKEKSFVSSENSNSEKMMFKFMNFCKWFIKTSQSWIMSLFPTGTWEPRRFFWS